MTRVRAIMDYRNARAAIDLLNGGDAGYEALMKRPEMGDLLIALHRAQGSTLPRETLLARKGSGDG